MSPIDLADRRHVPEALTRPRRLTFKGVDTDTEAVNGQMLAVDEAEGIVTAVVSVTGIEDEVADIIHPGAYRETLLKRRPKVCWAHKWDAPIGRVLHIEELLPGDSRLPRRQRDGSVWPKDAGALVATMQFNMRSVQGKDAFEAVVFYSESGECEYSIGYQVMPGKSTKDKAGVRHIKALELYELSVVLFGAHTMTGTLSIKDAGQMARERKHITQVVRNTDRRTAAAVLAEIKAAIGGDSTGGDSTNKPPPFTKKPAAEEQSTDNPDNEETGQCSKCGKTLYRRDGEWQDEDNSTECEKGGQHESTKNSDTDEQTPAPTETAPEAEPAARPGEPVPPAKTADEIEDEKDVPDFSNGVMVAVYPDPAAADQVAAQIAGPDTTIDRADLHVTLAYLGTTGEVGIESDTLVRLVTEAIEGMPGLEGEIAGIGMFPEGDDGVPTWVPVDVPGLGLLRETIVNTLGDEVRSDHGFTPHMTLGYDIGLTDPITPVPVTFNAVRVVFGNEQHDITLDRPVEGEAKMRTIPIDPDGSYIAGDGSARITGKALLNLTRDAAGVVSWEEYKVTLDTEPDMDEYLAAMTDRDWDAIVNDPEVKAWADEIEMEIKAVSPGGRPADSSPVGTPGGRQNWVDRAGGLPKYIRMVAHALIRKGKSKSRAIAIAVSQIKKWAAGLNNVSAKVQAAAAAALAQWEAMKAKDDGKPGKALAYDPALDVEQKMLHGSFPHLEGSFEERQAAIERAVRDALRGESVDDDGDQPRTEGSYEWDNVEVQGTWPDHVIATRRKWADDISETYEMTYEITDLGVELGEPERIELLLVAVDPDTGEDVDKDDVSLADYLDLAGDVDGVSFALKASQPVMEAKAGRVLSGRNERALRESVERLIDVLAAAGVKIHDDDGPKTVADKETEDNDQRVEMDPDVDLETTSPSANRSRGVKVLTRAQIEADLAALQVD